MAEMSAREAEKSVELSESRYPRYEAGSKPAPQELSAGDEVALFGGPERDWKSPV